MAGTGVKGQIGRWAFTLFGLIFFSIGATIMYANYSFVQNSNKTVGRVVHVYIDRDSDGTTYKPTVRFSVEGREYEAQSWLSSSGYDFRIGTEVPVLYDIDDPSRIRLDYFMEKWGFGAIFAVVGGLFTAIGLWIGISWNPSRRPARKKKPKPSVDKGRRPLRDPDDVLEQPTRIPTVRRR